MVVAFNDTAFDPSAETPPITPNENDPSRCRPRMPDGATPHPRKRNKSSLNGSHGEALPEGREAAEPSLHTPLTDVSCIDMNSTSAGASPFAMDNATTHTATDMKEMKIPDTTTPDQAVGDCTDNTKNNNGDPNAPATTPGGDSVTEHNTSDGSDTWEGIVAAVQASEQSETQNRVETYQNMADRLTAAQQQLEVIYSKVERQLGTLVNDKLLANVVRIHDALFAHWETIERELRTGFVRHYERRADLLRRWEDVHNAWCSHYERTYVRISSMGVVTPTTEDGIYDEKTTSNEVLEDNHPKSAKEDISGTGQAKNDQADNEGNESGAGDEEEEPDWEELKATFGEDRVNTFLYHQEQWHIAEEEFGTLLDDVHARLTEITAAMLATVAEAFDSLATANEEQQGLVQQGIAHNFIRRQQLEEAIAEAAAQQKSMFDQLFSRLGKLPNLPNFFGGFGGKGKSNTK